MLKDELGARLKQEYEDALRITFPRRTHLILRIDGRAFHQFTRGLERPYCRPLADALDTAALALAAQFTGCRFAYGQSDEYSFLATDMEGQKARMWFDGNVQKIVSVAASVFTAAFAASFVSKELATFDCRALVIPPAADVERYFLWRQLDASANSLNMLASAHYSHAELLGKSEADKHELLHAKGVNWAKQPTDFKRGRAILRGSDGGWYVDHEVPIFQREPAYLGSLLRESAVE
jgi:tRNA(His) 5'-end guanylyltransferase